MYRNVQLFITSKTVGSDVAMFKYSLHKYRETIIHWKYQLIYAWRSFIVQNPLKLINNADYKHQ